MRKSLKVMAMIMVSGLMSIQLFAADFSDKSLEELNAIRGTLRSASVQDRNDFRQEWQSRLNAMTPDERSKYMGPPANALRDGGGYGKKGSQRMGKGRGQGNGQGQGNQSGNRKGNGKGMGNGQGYNQ